MPSAVDDEGPDDENDSNQINDSIGAEPLTESEQAAFEKIINTKLSDLRDISIEELANNEDSEKRAADFGRFCLVLDECISDTDELLTKKIPEWVNGWNAKTSTFIPGQIPVLDRVLYKSIIGGAFLLNDYHSILTKFKELMEPYVVTMDWTTAEDFLFEQSSSKSLSAPNAFKNLATHPRAGAIFIARMNAFKEKLLLVDGIIGSIASTLDSIGVRRTVSDIGDEPIEGCSIEGILPIEKFEDWDAANPGI